MDPSEVQIVFLADDFQSSQWVFLADASVGGDRDWLLAVNSRAGHQAMDFLGEQDVGKAVSAKDLWLDGRDEQNALWKVRPTLFLGYLLKSTLVYQSEQCNRIDKRVSLCVFSPHGAGKRQRKQPD